MAQTAIEWTSYLNALGVAVRGYTFNAWLGCDKVSPACRICYITRTPALRTRGMKHGDPRQRTAPNNWKLPLRWNRKAAKEGVRPRVFTNSLADWLDDQVPVQWLADLLHLVRLTPNLDWLMLTKRPQNWRQRLMDAANYLRDQTDHCLRETCQWISDWVQWNKPPSNVWLGVTAEDQKRADERTAVLVCIPAVVRFLSMEPLLGFVDIGLRSSTWIDCAEAWSSRWVRLTQTVRSDFVGIVPGEIARAAAPGIYRARANKHGALSVMTPGGELGIKPDEFECLPGIDWVIVGGESGDKDDKPLPSHPDWFRFILKQCRGGGVPFFFKQRGDWIWEEPLDSPDEEDGIDVPMDWRERPEEFLCIETDGSHETGYNGRGATFIARLGKHHKLGGRLDGQIYHEFPTPRK